MAGLSTDPRSIPPAVHRSRRTAGPYVRIFLALDEDGNVIPNMFLVIMDYTGINYDYNDNIFVIEGVSRSASARSCGHRPR